MLSWVREARSILDVNVWLNIVHPEVADLDVELVSPNGTVVELFGSVVGAGADLQNVIFDDQAANTLATAVAPYTGLFRPDGRLADLDAENPNGEWVLHVTDVVMNHTGTVESWGMSLQMAGEGAHVYHWDVANSGFYCS